MPYTIIRDAICIRVYPEGEESRTAFEFANFYIRDGVRNSHNHPEYWCQLSVYSSLGNGGHHWSHMGQQTALFLSKAEKDYVLQKLFGDARYEFDSAVTETQLIQMLLQDRRQGDLTKAQARDCYDAIKDLGEGYTQLQDFCDAYVSYNELMHWLRPSEIPFAYKYTPQMNTFWEQMWPEFIKGLNEEALRPRDIMPN